MTQKCFELRRRHGAGLLVLLAATALELAAAGHAAAGATDHVVTFVNRCQQQVWIGELGSSSIAPHDWALAPRCTAQTASSICPSGTCHDGACTCTSDADCAFGAPAGTPTASCDTNRGRCVSKVKIHVPAGWSGRFWPRTGCSGSSTSFVCETGQCGPATGGNIDCTVQGSSANLATLFEITAAGPGGADNFDVSLVSGFNVPLGVKVVLAADAARWRPSTAYAAGAQIVAKVGKSVFGFTNGGQAGTSGTTPPAFPGTWTASVADGPDITWVNTGPACETSGCTRKGVKEKHCPADLKVTSTGGAYIACDVPANVCGQQGSPCAAGLSYYQCQNNGGETDLFGDAIGLQSPNAETFVCFSPKDCPAGTTCQLDPTFVSSFTLPSGAGLCTPVAQNGGCTTDGDPCGHFPFVEYRCQTLADETSNAQVCVPPTTTGMGNLWWNAENWTAAASPPQCSTDADCGGSNKCLQGPATLGGLRQCPDGDTCTCWSPNPCTSNADCAQPNTCLDANGVPDGEPDGSGVVDCTTETCYCGPQAIYSGVCGATNQGWLDAAAALTDGEARWPQGFKETCPIAYSYQYDDPSSNWSCTNGGQGLNDYRVILCGSAGR
ncbi:MAG: thaumatin family protein [Thermodesulfobacteriota bacterium]